MQARYARRHHEALKRVVGSPAHEQLHTKGVGMARNCIAPVHDVDPTHGWTAKRRFLERADSLKRSAAASCRVRKRCPVYDVPPTCGSGSRKGVSDAGTPFVVALTLDVVDDLASSP
jgi:hypothetical protein